MIKNNKAYNIRRYVENTFPKLGVNKRQEITRLLFEIANRDQQAAETILSHYPYDQYEFAQLKKWLIAKRYPETVKHNPHFNPALKNVEIHNENKVVLKKLDVNEVHFYVEKAVEDCELISRIKSHFQEAKITPISTYKDYISKKDFKTKDYNNRLKKFFIVKENYDFFKRCPCSNNSVSCGYHVVNLGSGCAFDCSYCYLQDYINSPGIIIPGNLEDFFLKFVQYNQHIRVGSGELTDSLVFDHITGYSKRIVNFFRDYPESSFEFKTKSNRVEGLLSVKGCRNVVISWSINPQEIISSFEHLTANLQERLVAAKACAQAGYRVAFHFDPVIYYDRWKEGYTDLIKLIQKEIPQDSIAWMSLGTLRMTPRLKTIIENRFPQTSFLNSEFISSHDGKLRYNPILRQEIYKHMLNNFKSFFPDVYVYLCMEDKLMCKSCEAPPMKKFTHTA